MPDPTRHKEQCPRGHSRGATNGTSHRAPKVIGTGAHHAETRTAARSSMPSIDLDQTFQRSRGKPQMRTLRDITLKMPHRGRLRQ